MSDTAKFGCPRCAENVLNAIPSVDGNGWICRKCRTKYFQPRQLSNLNPKLHNPAPIVGKIADRGNIFNQIAASGKRIEEDKLAFDKRRHTPAWHLGHRKNYEAARSGKADVIYVYPTEVKSKAPRKANI